MFASENYLKEKKENLDKVQRCQGKTLKQICICCYFPPLQLKASFFKKLKYRASLVAQWLRVCLPMRGTRVRALVWEDPRCRGATGPVSHNY